MRAVLVTGAAGFLGRHFVRELLRRDYDEVHGIDLMPGTSRVGETIYRHYRDDVRDFFGGPQSDYVAYDLVVHCAAVEPHRAAIDDVNVNMSHNLEIDAAMFRWAATTEQRHVLYISSSAVYPIELQTAAMNQELGAELTVLHESDVNLDDPEVRVPDKSYGWTKWIGEYQARQVRTAGVPVTVVRPFSGYGEDQSENFPFRAFVERARRRESPFTVWGNSDQVRDFIHVSDVVRGALAAVEADVVVTNLCTGVGTSMAQLAVFCMTEAGYGTGIEVDPDAPLGVACRVGDPTRMLEFYEPEVSLDEGVARALTHKESM